MTGLPTANEIAQKLIWLGRALNTGVDELKEADVAHIRAKGRYRKAHAVAVLKVAADHRGDKSVLAAERDAEVDEATYTEWLDAEVAEAKLREVKERQKVLYEQVELARSLNAGLRVDAQLAGAA